MRWVAGLGGCRRARGGPLARLIGDRSRRVGDPPIAVERVDTLLFLHPLPPTRLLARVRLLGPGAGRLRFRGRPPRLLEPRARGCPLPLERGLLREPRFPPVQLRGERVLLLPNPFLREAELLVPQHARQERR